MDSIGGAKILTTRLLRDAGDAAADAVPPIAEDALPVFHWAGVEPAEEPQEAAAPPPRRRWRFRSG